MKLKLQEGVYSLLNIDNNFYPALFDFTEPWKIDIFDFLNENYMSNLSIEEIASFTGRSLATFKRDFKKISPLPPQKWLIEKRLEKANNKLLNENKKVSDVYLEVGFKNLSHFSSAYKKQFGHSPAVVYVCIRKKHEINLIYIKRKGDTVQPCLNRLSLMHAAVNKK